MPIKESLATNDQKGLLACSPSSTLEHKAVVAIPCLGPKVGCARDGVRRGCTAIESIVLISDGLHYWHFSLVKVVGQRQRPSRAVEGTIHVVFNVSYKRGWLGQSGRKRKKIQGEPTFKATFPTMGSQGPNKGTSGTTSTAFVHELGKAVCAAEEAIFCSDIAKKNTNSGSAVSKMS